MTTDSYIFINGVRFHAYHGVMPQERVVGADFTVDVKVGYDMTQVIDSDNITHAINYAQVADIIAREMAIPSQLLEHVAGRTAKAILNELPMAQYVYISITKDNPPMGIDSMGAGVVLNVTRN